MYKLVTYLELMSRAGGGGGGGGEEQEIISWLTNNR